MSSPELRGYLKMLWKLVKKQIIRSVEKELDGVEYDDVDEMLQTIAGHKGVIQRIRWIPGVIRGLACDAVLAIDETDLEIAKALIKERLNKL